MLVEKVSRILHILVPHGHISKLLHHQLSIFDWWCWRSWWSTFGWWSSLEMWLVVRFIRTETRSDTSSPSKVHYKREFLTAKVLSFISVFFDQRSINHMVGQILINFYSSPIIRLKKTERKKDSTPDLRWNEFVSKNLARWLSFYFRPKVGFTGLVGWWLVLEKFGLLLTNPSTHQPLGWAHL